ncbi:MAG: hypothetical protein FRX49_09138 [Trebouxia sp. A1-2]|nr:MAG: hypothetical protein FRX49_09138 [Trebouxia sp. A1-2]
MPELRIALLNIAFTQNPALKATLRRASSTESIPKLSGDQDFPPTISTACSTSPSTPVTRSPQAFLDEKPAQQESTEQQSPSSSPPNEQEFKQLKQQLDSHDRRIKRHEKILEERKRQDRQYALVLYGLKELDVQPPQDWKSKDDSMTQLLKACLNKDTPTRSLANNTTNVTQTESSSTGSQVWKHVLTFSLFLPLLLQEWNNGGYSEYAAQRVVGQWSVKLALGLHRLTGIQRWERRPQKVL